MQAGISYSQSEGADSVVVSGGYEDDEDYGDLIIYTGHGGNDPATKRQVADQEFTNGNLALAKNCADGLPVRVTRGAGGDPLHSPATGFRYDGIYTVESYWHTTGKSGFRIYQYRLVQSVPSTANRLASPPTQGPEPRVETTTQRIIRNTAVAQRVKTLHHHQCQVCGTALGTATGPYAEGAHIRPLGRPHDGPDHESNVLCLCPNHHVLFDAGAIVIGADLAITDTIASKPAGTLRTVPGHRIDADHLEYHRTTIGR
jgi:putative restriction endonuclease